MSKTQSHRICEDSARECIRLARMTDDPELRVELFKIARDWMEISMEQREE
jgi:hypothetical protein